MTDTPSSVETTEQRRASLSESLAQVEDAIAECFRYGKDEPAYTAELKLRHRLVGARFVGLKLHLLEAIDRADAAESGARPRLAVE
jgi:hypothetical protein